MVCTLTDRFVAGIRPAGRQAPVFDTKVRGLALRVGTRTKVWYFTYRNGGATRWLRLGSYPALTLREARRRVTVERARIDQPHAPAAISHEVITHIERALVAAVISTIRQELASHDQKAH